MTLKEALDAYDAALDRADADYRAAIQASDAVGASPRP